jgi:ectoine hydroxylase-related dioxygenase (phytanoyl-CoA dioxygenase family)
MEITITAEELASEQISQTHLEQALQALRMDGYVILENVVSHAHLDILREKMNEDSWKMIKAKQWGGAGRVFGHLQQGAPPFPPYVFRDVVANPIVIQTTKALLGEGLFNSFYNGNTNCPGSGVQPLHMDGEHLWPGLKVAHPIASVVVNVALMDVTEENGGIELWPGSHLDASAPKRIDPAREEARRKIAPPVRGNTKKGSVLIRDMRLWHRGAPNYSDQPRHMIAMIHNARWLRRGRPLKFGKGCEEAFSNSDFDPNVEFTDAPIDYLGLRPGNY